jgi:Uri superfamily endonuclease
MLWGCVCLKDDKFAESALSFYFYVGSGDQNRVSRHAQQAPLTTEPAHER